MNEKTAQSEKEKVRVFTSDEPDWTVCPPGVEPGGYAVGLQHNSEVGDVIVFGKGSVALGHLYKHPCGEVCYTQDHVPNPSPLRKIALLQLIAYMDQFDEVVGCIKKILEEDKNEPGSKR